MTRNHVWTTTTLWTIAVAAAGAGPACRSSGDFAGADGGPPTDASSLADSTFRPDSALRTEAAAPLVPTRLDPSCAGTGRAVFPIGVGTSDDHARAVSRLAGGRTVIVGTVDEPVSVESIQDAYFASVRLLADCSIDSSYASAGLGYFAVSDPDYQVEDIQQVRFAADGSPTLYGQSLQTVVGDAGATEQQPAVTAARIELDGSRDPAFGTPFLHVFRTPTAPYPDRYDVRGIHPRADGSVRLLGQAGGPYDSIALLTLRADHAFDPAATIVVDRDGTVPGLGYEAHRVEGLAELGDGSTLVAGTFVHTDGTSQLPGVLKLNATGAVDLTFGAGGVGGAGNAGDVESGTQLAVQPDGKILVAGVLELEGRYQSLGVIRLNGNGSVDLSFGNRGVSQVDLGQGRIAGTANVYELVQFSLLPDGSMLLGGSLYALDAAEGEVGSLSHVGVTRLLSDGTLDPSFADAGVFDAAALSAGAPEVLNGFEQAADGTVSIVATRTTNDDGDWVLYRLARQP